MIGWRILLWAVLVVTVLLFLYMVRGILPPFIMAFIIAALLEPVIRWLRLRGLKRFWAVSFVFVLFFGAVIGTGLLVGPKLANQVSDLTAQLDDLTRSLARTSERENFFLRWNPLVQAQRAAEPNRIDQILQRYRGPLERFDLPTTQREIVQRYIEPRRTEIVATVRRAFDSFLGILKNVPAQLLYVFLTPILVFMMLMDMENFKQKIPRWIPPAIRGSTIRLFEDIGDVFTRYLRGVTTVVILFTVVITLLFLLLDVPYAALVGLAFGALYLIPYIGNIVSCIVLFSLIGFGGVQGVGPISLSSPWAYAAVCTAIFLAIGFMFDHFIYPQMVGSSVGLNGVVSMFVILCGGALFGLPGMIFAFPLAGAVKVVLERLLRVTSTTGEQLQLPPVPIRHRANVA